MPTTRPVVGVLALQGAVSEHMRLLDACGAHPIEIKRSKELAAVDGLIIPGGESTTIAKLTGAEAFDAIMDDIQERALAGMPVYGTCMGSIFLAKEIEGSNQGRLGLMDIRVRRNAFGSQRFSSEREVPIPQLRDEPFNAVFIRAPIILSCGPSVNVMASIEEGIVMARQNNLLVTSFHPELTDDALVHRYFLSIISENNRNLKSGAVSTRSSVIAPVST
ncbi:MAG: pyridoxal 5'-phosphate synthase glutaminase subunit PdxT [Candidatus Obscuribacterales bacterium]|nr:pyridoxal 5'-phosphate synthase glutaminase subunit PdxT [Candidatus Obscuribacterales bacterium]